MKRYLLDVFLNCQHMHRMLSEEHGGNINETALYAYHSMSFAAFMSMRAYYMQNADDIAHQEFDEFFQCYRRFIDEFISSRATHHSMQHTFIHYDELDDAYSDLARLLGMDHTASEKR